MVKKGCFILIILTILLVPAFAESRASYYSNLADFGSFTKNVVFDAASSGLAVLGFSGTNELPSDGIGISEFTVDSNTIKDDGKLYGNGELYAFWWITDVGENGGTLSVKKDDAYLHVGDAASQVGWAISNPQGGKWATGESGELHVSVTSANRSGAYKFLLETGPVEAVASDITYTGTLTLTYKGN